MSTKAAVLERAGARERLLAAAEELFYEEGVNTVGIDRVIERAGVAKASLYNVFGSKDELIRAYLVARHEARVARITARLGRCRSAQEKILALFDDLYDVAEKRGFRGCPFVRASAEAKTGDSVKEVCDQTRHWLQGLVARLVRETGAREPQTLTGGILLLYDGATVSAQMDRDSAVVRNARAAAARLLEAAFVKRAAMTRRA